MFAGDTCITVGGQRGVHINYSSYKLWITKGSHWRLIFHMKYDHYYSSPLFLDLFMAIYLFRRKKNFSPFASGILSDGRKQKQTPTFLMKNWLGFYVQYETGKVRWFALEWPTSVLAHEHANDLSTASKQTTRKNEWHVTSCSRTCSLYLGRSKHCYSFSGQESPIHMCTLKLACHLIITKSFFYIHDDVKNKFCTQSCF